MIEGSRSPRQATESWDILQLKTNFTSNHVKQIVNLIYKCMSLWPFYCFKTIFDVTRHYSVTYIRNTMTEVRLSSLSVLSTEREEALKVDAVKTEKEAFLIKITKFCNSFNWSVKVNIILYCTKI